jgi:hypothetical protein|tara:strand:+ start:704 stop:1576 length:873 start_codon:yes stop_codon:yes gene_type:complete
MFKNVAKINLSIIGFTRVLAACGLFACSTSLFAWEVTSDNYGVDLSQLYSDNVTVQMSWSCETSVNPKYLSFYLSGVLQKERPGGFDRIEVLVDGYKLGDDFLGFGYLSDVIRINTGSEAVNRLTRGKVLVLSGGPLKYDYYKKYALTGTAAGITEAVSLCQKKLDAAKSTQRNLYVMYAILGVIGLCFALWFAVKVVIPGLKKTTQIAKAGAAQAKRVINSSAEEAKAKKVRGKIEDAFIDEVVREAVRQAMRKGLSPDDIEVCSACAGRGCSQCNDKGWLLGGQPFEE